MTEHSRSSTCGFRVCFFCLSARSASSAQRSGKSFLSEKLSEGKGWAASGPDHLLRGSASMLLRLCWDEADSLGLAGLLLARLSPPLMGKQKKKF